MLKELELRIDDMVFTQKGDYLSLFESTSTFVNKELATFYGVPFTATDSAFHKVDLPGGTPRVGILGSAAILAGHGHEQLTSPTHRGKVRRRDASLPRPFRRRRPACRRCRRWPHPARRCGRS